MYRHATSAEDYLSQRYEIVGDCWIWTSHCDSNGYGLVGTSKYGKIHKIRNAHQLAYLVWNGDNPAKLHVLHKCDVRNCINPFHLFLGTNQDNVDDKMQKGRWNGRKPTFNEIEICSYWNTLSCYDVASKFHTSFTNIARIWRKHGLTRKIKQNINTVS